MVIDAVGIAEGSADPSPFLHASSTLVAAGLNLGGDLGLGVGDLDA